LPHIGDLVLPLSDDLGISGPMQQREGLRGHRLGLCLVWARIPERMAKLVGNIYTVARQRVE
jgi:hypothetical protein